MDRVETFLFRFLLGVYWVGSGLARVLANHPFWWLKFKVTKIDQISGILMWLRIPSGIASLWVDPSRKRKKKVPEIRVFCTPELEN